MKESGMRILGVDPGLTRCGVALVEKSGNRLHLIGAEALRSPADMDHAYRLLTIHDKLKERIEQSHPDAVAVERVFAQHNRSTVAGTTQVAGIAMMLAASYRIPVFTYTPSEVKAAVSGSGKADKAQVGAMVMRILKLESALKPADAADAAALAICHLWRGGTINRYAQALARITSPSVMRGKR